MSPGLCSGNLKMEHENYKPSVTKIKPPLSISTVYITLERTPDDQNPCLTVLVRSVTTGVDTLPLTPYPVYSTVDLRVCDGYNHTNPCFIPWSHPPCPRQVPETSLLDTEESLECSLRRELVDLQFL